MIGRSPVLAIVVPDLYRASVTFFHEHIKSIGPGRTVVVHLSTTGAKANIAVPVLEVVKARPLEGARLTRPLDGDEPWLGY